MKVPKGATVRTDEDGEYLAFHKHCKHCCDELTSRNRYQETLLCRDCFNERARVVAAANRDDPNYVPSVPKERLKTPPGGPDRQAIHHLLTAFLAQPKITEHKDKLLAALVDYELKEWFHTL